MTESGETDHNIAESKHKDTDSSNTRQTKSNFLRRAISTAARKFGTTGPGFNPFTGSYQDIFLPNRESQPDHLSEDTEKNKPNEEK